MLSPTLLHHVFIFESLYKKMQLVLASGVKIAYL
jgi:hypothetical protein